MFIVIFIFFWIFLTLFYQEHRNFQNFGHMNDISNMNSTKLMEQNVHTYVVNTFTYLDFCRLLTCLNNPPPPWENFDLKFGKFLKERRRVVSLIVPLVALLYSNNLWSIKIKSSYFRSCRKMLLGLILQILWEKFFVGETFFTLHHKVKCHSKAMLPYFDFIQRWGLWHFVN